MTDIAKLKALAEAQIGFKDMSLAPDVVLELIAEITKLQDRSKLAHAGLRSAFFTCGRHTLRPR